MSNRFRWFLASHLCGLSLFLASSAGEPSSESVAIVADWGKEGVRSSIEVGKGVPEDEYPGKKDVSRLLSVEVVKSDAPPTGSASSPEAAIGEVQEPGSRKLTLDEAIQLCLVSDPVLRAGFEAINQASADALTASLKPNPLLFTDIQLLPLTRPFTETAQGGPPQQDVQLGYPIDWFLFGKRAATMAAAQLGVRVSEAEYADLIRRRVAEVAIAFLDALEAEQLLSLANQDVDSFQRVEAATQRAVEGGGRPRIDLQRIRLDLLNSQRSLREAKLGLAQAIARLEALVGRVEGDPRIVVDGSIAEDPPYEALTLEAAYRRALDDRPDLHSLRWRVEQARADIRTEQRRACPPLQVTFGYTRQYQTKAIGFPDANSWTAAVETNLPLFDRNQGNRSKAASKASQAQQEVRAAEIAVLAEIEQAFAELATARSNAKALTQEQLQLAGEVRSSIAQAYAAGGRPLLDVIDAQRNYRETYRAYIVTRANYWRAVYRLSSAIGRQIGLP